MVHHLYNDRGRPVDYARGRRYIVTLCLDMIRYRSILSIFLSTGTIVVVKKPWRILVNIVIGIWPIALASRATSYCLKLCWPRSPTHYFVTGGQWVNDLIPRDVYGISLSWYDRSMLHRHAISDLHWSALILMDDCILWKYMACHYCWKHGKYDKESWYLDRHIIINPS